MTNDEIVAKVNAYQACPWVHPLTCGNDSRHRNLVPTVVGGEVILVCEDCDYEQLRFPIFDVPPDPMAFLHSLQPKDPT